MNHNIKGTNKDKIHNRRNEITEISPNKDLSIEINVRKCKNKDRTNKSDVNKRQPSLKRWRSFSEKVENRSEAHGNQTQTFESAILSFIKILSLNIS